MIVINPLHALLWILRRNEKDVVRLYGTMSPMMQAATGGEMLNFGLWDESHTDPISAQINLCSRFADLAELRSAGHALDIGSGLSAPAKFWRGRFDDLSLYCINTNYPQLRHGCSKDINSVNASSTALPFADGSTDRILALESAQHFRPFSKFLSESHRVLSDSGLMALAIPITHGSSSAYRLGILKITWSSEHYSLDQIRNLVDDAGFSASDMTLIGPSVYEPLADYYFENRTKLRKLILRQYSALVEQILFRSLQKMKHLSQSGVIDYVLLKCRP